MIASLSGFINEIKIYVVCKSGYMTIEDIIEKMVEKKMLSFAKYDISQVNCTLVLEDLQEHLRRYSEAEVMAYFLKYMFDFKNDEIFSQRLFISDGMVNCKDLNIRRVERIHLNVRRRVFAQPRYTKETFVYISDIIGNDKFRELVRNSQTAAMTVQEFVQFHFESSLLNHDGTLNKINKIKDIVTTIRPWTKFVDTSEFPWNLLVTINRDYHINVYQKLMDFLSANGLSIDDIFSNRDIVNEVIAYNLCAFTRISARTDVLIAKFVKHEALSDIQIPRWDDETQNVSVTRIKQIYDSAMEAIVSAISNNGRFLFDGFELFAKKLKPDPVADKLLHETLPRCIHDMINAVIPTAATMTLQEIASIIYSNPLIHHVIVYGFIKGIIVSNQELRESNGISRTPSIPENISELNLSQRSTNALIRSGIHKTIDLITLSYDDLHSIKNIGQKSFDEIVDTLRLFGVHINDKEETPYESTFTYTHP